MRGTMCAIPNKAVQGQFEDTKKRLVSEHSADMEKAAAKAAQQLAEKDAEMREALATAERDATEAVAKAQQDVETRIASAVKEWQTKFEEAQVSSPVVCSHEYIPQHSRLACSSYTPSLRVAHTCLHACEKYVYACDSLCVNTHLSRVLPATTRAVATGFRSTHVVASS